jgi:hypothetical protein
MMMMKSTCMAQVSIPWNAHCALKKRGDKNSNDRTEIDKRRQLGAWQIQKITRVGCRSKQKGLADSMFFRLSGRLFQSLGAALLKALAPDRFLLVSSTAGRLKRDWETLISRPFLPTAGPILVQRVYNKAGIALVLSRFFKQICWFSCAHQNFDR